MLKTWILVPGLIAGFLVSGFMSLQKPVLAGEIESNMTESRNRSTQQYLAQEVSPAVQQVANELLAQIVVLEDFVLQNPDVFEIRDPEVFQIRDPEVFQTLATPIRALDDLKLLTRALRSPNHTADGVTLVSALNDSLEYFPDFVRSSQFISAYRRLNTSDQSTVDTAVIELAEALKVMRNVAVAEIGGEVIDAEQEATEIESVIRRVRDEDDMNWRN